VYKDKTILTIIPARGGSKGLQRKNILPLLGKPLIAWTIEQALESKYLDRIVVSTDDEKIAEIAKKYGAEVPFIRPAELATDTAATTDVILHALDFFERKRQYYNYFALLEPTSPLRDTKDVDNAIQILLSTPEAESIVGVCEVTATHPSFLVRLDNYFLRPFLNKTFEIKRRQDIEKLYFFEGSLYIASVESFKTRKNYYHEKALGYIVPKWKSYEVDDLSDFIIIEALMKVKLDGQLAI
jgi:N-acylneuraminate cytidylyltransferase/CMP-N,N'-diacetyllegionaminic acid synthase